MPKSGTRWSETWNGDPAGTRRLSTGTRIAPEREKQDDPRGAVDDAPACFDGPALQREQAAGRFWMKRMMATRRAILPSTAPAKGSSTLLAIPSESAPTRVPQVAHAAEDHDQKAVDDVGLTEVRAHVVDLREGDPGHAGDPEPRPNVRASILSVLMPMAAAMRRSASRREPEVRSGVRAARASRRRRPRRRTPRSRPGCR